VHCQKCQPITYYIFILYHSFEVNKPVDKLTNHHQTRGQHLSFTIQNSKPVPHFFCLLHSPSQEEESADVCQEEPDLRLRHGFHYQCHAHRSQSDAAERHGVTNCTVSMASGQNSHDLTSRLCSQSRTSYNPSTSLNNQLRFFLG